MTSSITVSTLTVTNTSFLAKQFVLNFVRQEPWKWSIRTNIVWDTSGLTGLCKKKGRKWINIDYFLINFLQLNGTVQARYTLLRGNKNTDDIGRIIRVNDEPTQNIYKQHEKCNVINGTDKTFFPPFQKKRDTIWVYSHDACISFPLVYAESTFLKGAWTAFKKLYLSDPLVRIHFSAESVSFTF